MYIYNVTLKVEMAIVGEWMKWMRSTHIPAVMETGFFTEYRICRLLDEGDTDGSTFVIQYSCPSIDDFLAYQTTRAPQLQQEHSQKFGQKVIAFRTIMEVM